MDVIAYGQAFRLGRVHWHSPYAWDGVDNTGIRGSALSVNPSACIALGYNCTPTRFRSLLYTRRVKNCELLR